MHAEALTPGRADHTSVRTLIPTRPPRPLEPSVTVVIPTLNEAQNLGHVLDRIPVWVAEVIIVDGLSSDNTVAVARAHRSDVRIIDETRRGKGYALRVGFEAATSDIVVALDADGSMDPCELPAFVGALIAGADVALGSRFAVGGGTTDMEWIRKVGNHILRTLVTIAWRAQYTDLCYGYMSFWRDVWPALDAEHAGFEVETKVHIRARQKRLKVAEVPSFEARRMHGVSNLRTFRDGFAVLRTIVRERCHAQPVPFPTWITPVDSAVTPPWATR